MNIAITGATGFIGRGITSLLLEDGHHVAVLTRNPGKVPALFADRVKAIKLATDNLPELVGELEHTDAFINLAGENIGSSLWTKKKRGRILDSRLSVGRFLTDLISSMKKRPDVLIQASAVGFYGSRGEEKLDEGSSPGDGFLSDVVRRWEDSTKDVEALGVRRVIIRSGVVFASDGGALPKLALPYTLFFGTVMGSGKQWVPWIHYLDELEAIRFMISKKFASGIYNLVSPNPARMDDVCRAIGEALHRPTLLHIPAPILEIALGEMAEETILPSQRVSPSRLAEAGFEFRHAGLKSSIGQIFSHDNEELERAPR